MNAKAERGMAVIMALLLMARAGRAQTGNAQTEGVPAANPAVRTEHTPARTPQQMKAVPQQAPQGSGNAAPGPELAAQKTAEDVLAELVKSAGVIFVGQVYAIRVPAGQENPGTKGGLHSSRPGVVEIEFRVDQGVRGPSVGDPFVLRESEEQWKRDAAQLGLHQRAIVFLYPANKDGLSSPVGGAVGVIPKENDNQVDLTRLHALVTGAPANTSAGGAAVDAATESESSAASSLAGEALTPLASATPPDVTDVSTPGGEQMLTVGTGHGGMPELNATYAPFLAVLRDIYVLAAEQPPMAPKAGA